MRIISILLLPLLLQACAPIAPARSTDEYVAPSFKAPSPGSLLVLLPARSSASDVAGGEEFVLQQIHRQLTGAGYKVVALGAANYAVVWDQEVNAVGGVYDTRTGALRTAAYAQALSALAKRVASETHGALVISHGLVIRQAKLLGTNAEWDGQRRLPPTTKTYGSEYQFHGTTSALSVELLAIADDGTVAFKTLGGTSLPYRADTLAGQYEIRPDLFATDSETAEGVRIALRPLLSNK